MKLTGHSLMRREIGQEIRTTSILLSGKQTNTLYLALGSRIESNITFHNQTGTIYTIENIDSEIYGDIAVYGGTGRIDNNSLIDGSIFLDTQGSAVFNVGHITGDISINGGQTSIANYGIISGDIRYDTTDGYFVLNADLIEGSVNIKAGSGEFINFGTIHGDVSIQDNIGDGHTFGDIRNDGLIGGDVHLGFDNALLNNYGGEITGIVYAVGGDNQYFGGFKADVFVSGTGSDSFFLLKDGPDGRQKDLAHYDNGHDAFLQFSDNDLIVFKQNGITYSADGIDDLLLMYCEFIENGGDAWRNEDGTHFIFEFEGGGSFEVKTDQYSDYDYLM